MLNYVKSLPLVNYVKSSPIAMIFTKKENFPDVLKEQMDSQQNDDPASIKPPEENKIKKFSLVKGLGSDSVGNTVISEETEINGSITSRGNITVNGKVIGDITSEANIKITGLVEGDLKGKSVEIHSGKVKGNIISKSTVIISEKSAVEGDIQCDRLDLNGSVIGNSQVSNSSSLGKEAVIYGNITSQNLSIQEGAIVNGAVKVSKQAEPAAKNNPIPANFAQISSVQ